MTFLRVDDSNCILRRLCGCGCSADSRLHAYRIIVIIIIAMLYSNLTYAYRESVEINIELSSTACDENYEN